MASVMRPACSGRNRPTTSWEHVVVTATADLMNPARSRAPPRFLVNPTGKSWWGAPGRLRGLTGPQIIVDTYGGTARHGGGAFSGKDPTRWTRSAALCGPHWPRAWCGGLARGALQCSSVNAIGLARPTSILVQSFGTGKLGDEDLNALVRSTSICRPRRHHRKLWPAHLPQERGGRFLPGCGGLGHFGPDD